MVLDPYRHGDFVLHHYLSPTVQEVESADNMKMGRNSGLLLDPRSLKLRQCTWY